MSLVCSRCGKLIEFSGERPTFCPYCGVHLSSATNISSSERTAAYIPTPTDFTIDDSSGASEPGTDGIPSSIAGFRLTRLLGSGGMGAVYEGVSDDSGQHVAVKLLTTMSKASSGSLDRFRQEGRLASQLSHPRCVFVLQADEEAGRPYIVMELMPGETLREYVQAHGPLSADEAICKILDVIDGLIEAHRHNILHRDVKPSNCFLMKDGRVKIGDFGLSKSLTVDGNLTQTGSFLGTVLYAAPEQIKGETLDFAADVYSVCATLYFLLTGQAPFQHESPTAVISRVITESPPDIRTRRPDLPRRLQKIVMRGLERQPDTRFQSLDELRSALVELVCRPVTRGSLGSRIAAYVVDLMVLMPFWILLAVVENWVSFGDWPVFLVPKFVYFASTEYFWGCSLGKWVLRLRVRDAQGAPASLRIIMYRTVAFIVLTLGAGLTADALIDRQHPNHDETPIARRAVDIRIGDPPPRPRPANRLVELRIGIYLLGCISILSTMRARNGYRGLHEWISGTRVVQLPWPRSPRRIVPREEWDPPVSPLSEVAGLPTAFGGFQPAGVMEREGDTLRLHVCDSMLRRDVFLIARPEGNHAISEARKSLSRPQRTRWLAGGTTDGWAWDAFLAPAGNPLPALVTGGQRLGWPETVAILEQLGNELALATADGTLTGPVLPAHVFVRPDGQTQMLDSLGSRPLTDADGFALIRQVVPLALEGNADVESRPPGPIRAVMPVHARQTLKGLCDKAPAYNTVGEFRAALHEIETLPNETATPQRILSLATQGLLAGFPIGLLLLIVGMLGFINYEVAYVNKVTWSVLQRHLAENGAAVMRDYPKLEDPIRYQFLARVVSSIADKWNQTFSGANVGLNAAERFATRFTEPSFSRDEARQLAANYFASLTEDLEAKTVDDLTLAYSGDLRPSLGVPIIIAIGVTAACFVFWSYITRGGVSLALAGLALVRSDGRRAHRWQCAFRAFVMWVPALGLLALCVVVKTWSPQLLFLHNALWFLSVVWLVGFAVIGIMRPGRGPQDRLSGVWVVPR